MFLIPSTDRSELFDRGGGDPRAEALEFAATTDRRNKWWRILRRTCTRVLAVLFVALVFNAMQAVADSRNTIDRSTSGRPTSDRPITVPVVTPPPHQPENLGGNGPGQWSTNNTAGSAAGPSSISQ